MNPTRPIRIWAWAALAAVLLLTGVEAEAATHAATRTRTPDWSGVWERFDVGASGLGADPSQNRTILATMAQRPPYNAEWQAKIEAIRAAQARAGYVRSGCSPESGTSLGFPQSMLAGIALFQVLQTPRETALFFFPGGVRHIDTDGRPHPPADELLPSLMGDSIGHWEGTTLVVDTVGSTAPIPAADTTSPGAIMVPVSDQIHVAERIRLIARDTLENRITVNDPKAFSRPWEVTVQYHRVPGLRHVVESGCENDRNPVKDGAFTIAPPK